MADRFYLDGATSPRRNVRDNWPAPAPASYCHAARLMAEDGIADFHLAKRKAPANSGLPRTAYPTSAEVEAELRAYRSLLPGRRTRRTAVATCAETALELMELLAVSRHLTDRYSRGWPFIQTIDYPPAFSPAAPRRSKYSSSTAASISSHPSRLQRPGGNRSGRPHRRADASLVIFRPPWNVDFQPDGPPGRARLDAVAALSRVRPR